MGKRGAMAAGKVKQFWTAIVSFFCELLASLRSAAPVADRYPDAAATRTALTGAVSLPAQRTAAVPATGAGCGAGRRGRVPRERALPPTIKQRIRAEAHGASPAVRRLPAAGVPVADRPADRRADEEDAEAAVPAGTAAAR
ncbi:DUF6344 domain-containing protein [Streptomyces roseolilacinus]|uniref:DUF6344 domain-containing protein n=1 Tax=Streptomyces roseolilacinus TaxID=66904 RepID=UPI00381B24F5